MTMGEIADRPDAVETPGVSDFSPTPSEEAELVDAPDDETAESSLEEPLSDGTAEATSTDKPEHDEQATDDSEQHPEMHWYVLKVQSNRENSIRDAIVRRIKIEGLEQFVGDIVVPTEKVTEMKGGKKRVMERKFYPGYIICRLVLDDDVRFAIRETPGVGDFVGAGGTPVPMSEDDVARMLGRKEKAEEEKQPRLQINFEKGDRVKIKEGAFENFEGEVDEVIESKGLVRVMVQVFGRPTPVEVEYWQVEPV